MDLWVKVLRHQKLPTSVPPQVGLASTELALACAAAAVHVCERSVGEPRRATAWVQEECSVAAQASTPSAGSVHIEQLAARTLVPLLEADFLPHQRKKEVRP